VEIPLRTVAVPSPKRRTDQSSLPAAFLAVASLPNVHGVLVPPRSTESRPKRVEVTLAPAGCG
jgi:hypothetical protein